MDTVVDYNPDADAIQVTELGSLGQLPHLPEEIVLNVLSHMERRDLLALSCTSQTMNRLGIQHLLSASGIAKPTSYCKVVLDTDPESTTDSLMVLLHSTHIKEIKDLCFYYTRFHSYSSLASPLCRSLRLLRNLNCASEVTLSFCYEGHQPTDEEHLHEIVIILQDLLNEIIVKSCNKIRFFGSEGLLRQFYEFQKLGVPAPSTGELDKRLDKPQEVENSDDPITIDDLRYKRTDEEGSRIFLRCSQAALEKTRLFHFNFGTADILRPPFSQWTFPLLKACQIQSFSFAFSHLPTDAEELEFILRRLAAALPHIIRLYLYDIQASTLPVLINWINAFTANTPN